ncbi:MAG TPA: kelch repeat-containing protein [Gaiellaceae bacterium]|nr:kelch repeat-containing protein [Gaiellaceae bacterium]
MARVLWSQRQDLGPAPRAHHALAYDSARKRVVLFGGDLLGSTFAADTWAWDGEYWTQVADTGPSPRSGHRLAFDSQSSTVVLFGGSSPDGALLGDTWSWDGDGWTQIADTGPTARTAHAIAYDTARSRLVLFGGEVAASALQHDTWEWDAEAWTQVEDAGPGSRRHHALAFDASRGRTVLFGGDLGTESAADTWEWDGTTWVQVADMGPAACAAAAATFDGGAVLLFGGVASLGPTALAPAVSGLTWEWDGEHWTLRQDMGPRARWGHALAFDASRGKVVLFGGLTGATAASGELLGDTWEASAPAPAAVEIASFRLEPDAVPSGGNVLLVVDLAQPAPAGGVVVAITSPPSPDPLTAITIAAGAASGSIGFLVPGGGAAGDVELEARVGASARTTLLHVLPFAATLVSFTLTPDTVPQDGGTIGLDVGLDQPAPADAVVEISSGNSFLGILVQTGSMFGHAEFDVPGGIAPGEYPIEARLAGSVVTAMLHIV